MSNYCSKCHREETLSDIAEDKYMTEIHNEYFCEDCYENMIDSIFFCDRCCEYDYTINENFVLTKKYSDDIDNIYLHKKCLYEYEKCNICKNYLKNMECVEIFIDYGSKISYHKECVEDEENIYEHDICTYCGISLRVKCLECNHVFPDCYNNNCKNYLNYDANTDRYDGLCGECNW